MRERKKARQTKFLSFFSLRLAFVRSSFFVFFVPPLSSLFQKKAKEKREEEEEEEEADFATFFKERERKGQPLFLSFFLLFFGLSFCSFPTSHFFSPSSLKSSNPSSKRHSFDDEELQRCD